MSSTPLYTVTQREMMAAELRELKARIPAQKIEAGAREAFDAFRDIMQAGGGQYASWDASEESTQLAYLWMSARILAAIAKIAQGAGSDD